MKKTIDTFVKIDEVTAEWVKENTLLHRLRPGAKIEDLVEYSKHQPNGMYLSAERHAELYEELIKSNEWYVIRDTEL